MPWIRAKKTQNEEFEGEFWNEEELSKIEGIVEEVKIGAYNKYFMKIRTKKDILYITPQHYDLSKQIESLEIAKGDRVRVKYLGEVDTGQINSMKEYILEKWED
jgi:hypothetical protein